MGVLHLSCVRFASAQELAAVMGHLTWFALLNRPSLSSFDEVYAITRSMTEHREAVPDNVLVEIMVFMCLMPLLEGDLSRGWQEEIVATDASVDFGFGVSTAPAHGDTLRALSRAAANRDTLVRLQRAGTDEPAKKRKGTEFALPLKKSAFRTVISAKRHHDAHSGSLEATALGLGFRWLLRSVTKHSKRTVVLLDAKAVLGASIKGRTSAPTIKRDMRFVSALVLAGDLHVKALYVPSEDNPADAPSRGIVQRWRRRRSAVAPHARTGGLGKGAILKHQLKYGPHWPDYARGKYYNIGHQIWKRTHTGSRESQNYFRRSFRNCDWSDAGSLSSLSGAGD
eukprot:TRINITY_DN2370_c0_g1_i2.p1 TRINITY_DN2370_c0_g1~~TRINITY_DN2370_c0_g1_i2.p1  ORF type:complete len:340 (-),score=30.80 TRINITY_DN2370_c0_g1_i2:208-1227(-)